MFQISWPKMNFLSLFVLGLPLLSKAVIYQESLNEDYLTALFGDEDCVEGSLSVTESGDPVIKSASYVSAVPSQLSTIKTKESNDTASDKSPMSLVYELAEFNQVKVQFTLTDEKGPAHKKQFVISLKLGEEEYVGEGSSIKKAQHEASKLALNSTLYDHPPKRIKKTIIVENKKTPVQKLEDWARKHNGALVTYSYFEQSKLDNDVHKNYYHTGMYSKSTNVHKAKVIIANQAFSGEGSSLELAKQNAAKNALESLQNIDGFCMLTEKEKSFFNKVFDYNSDDANPMSLVHEFGTLSNMPVSFDLVSEEGPAHIKKFIFRCNVGDHFESFGEGSSKKSAKREAGENMIKKLKQHASFNGVKCVETLKKGKSKKKKSKNLIKSVAKTYSEEDEESTNNVDLIPEELDPVSKLFQIQQAKHEILPTFTLLEKSNNEFSFEVTVNDLKAVGSGPNKKTAKKNAAQAMLEQMGYSTHKKEQRFSQKKKDFSEKISNKKPIAPGINLSSNKLHDIQNTNEPTKSNAYNKNYKASKPNDKLQGDPVLKDTLNNKDTSDSKSNNKGSNSKKKSNIRPKSKLSSLSQQIGFKFQFSDFPKANNTGFVSLISMTTDPPKVCYGVGETSDLAQDKAALSALGSLYKSQLEHISQILQEDSAPTVKPDITFIEEDNIVRSGIGRETD